MTEVVPMSPHAAKRRRPYRQDTAALGQRALMRVMRRQMMVKEIADLFDVSDRTVYRWQAGDVMMPPEAREIVERIVRGEVDPEELT